MITGCNLKYNFSAGLSHNAYINGLIKLGYSVDLLCFSDENIDIDDDIILPPIRNIYSYNGVSLYEKISNKKNSKDSECISNDSIDESKDDLRSRIIESIKNIIRSAYGVYRMSIVWYYRAKRFESNVMYDYVISMSDPPVSHKLASFLINKRRIKANKWIQLWEDPWCDSYYGEKEINIPCMNEENKILEKCDDVVYVTPLTLKRQQFIFPKHKDKMRWCPLAAYYNCDYIDYDDYSENYYGYFGDYSPSVRNLRPFYNVAVNKGINVDICGFPDNLFPSINNVNIFPRLPLGELKKHEDKANIVICLFNLGGGQIPGKIYQLAATNKTILAILDGSENEQKILREYFEKFNRFVFCHNNEQSISEAIDRIENNDLGDISNEPIDDFSVEKVAKMLLGD